MSGFGYDPELPGGFQDADFEMRELEEAAREADRRQDRLTSLLQQGFDESKIDHDVVRFGCSQCCALSIQGLACHETGCPNAKKS